MTPTTATASWDQVAGALRYLVSVDDGATSPLPTADAHIDTLTPGSGHSVAVAVVTAAGTSPLSAPVSFWTPPLSAPIPTPPPPVVPGSPTQVLPVGSIVRTATDPHIWYIDGGNQRRWIINEAVLLQCFGILWTASSVVSDVVLAQTTQGPDINGPLTCPGGTVATCPPPGRVVFATPSGAVYVIDQSGHKRHVANVPALQQCGYNTAREIFMSDAQLAACPDGLPIYGLPDCPPQSW